MQHRKEKNMLFIRHMIAWEGNNYPFKCSASASSDLDSRFSTSKIAYQIQIRRVYPTLRDLTMKAEGNRRTGDNPWQSRGSRVCCADERAYVYTCRYVSGGHGFWPRYGCAPAFFLCHDHVHVLAFNGIRPHVSIDRSISRSMPSAHHGYRKINNKTRYEYVQNLHKLL